MGILDKFFRKPKLLDPADLSVLKADMHSHLVPSVDDGSESDEQSVEMLKRFIDLGYSKVVTTPHIMSDFYRNSSDKLRRGEDRLKDLVAKHNLNIEVSVAAEYYVDEYFEGLVQSKDLLTFGNNYVLFELAFMQSPNILKNITFELQMAGYKPIMAHPERYSYWHTDFDKYQEFHEKDIALQLNANSLSGAYGPEVKKVAEKLIDTGIVTFLGTDCHSIANLEQMELTRRTPHLHKLLDSGKLLNNTL